jgi:hypothetical protein
MEHLDPQYGDHAKVVVLLAAYCHSHSASFGRFEPCLWHAKIEQITITRQRFVRSDSRVRAQKIERDRKRQNQYIFWQQATHSYSTAKSCCLGLPSKGNVITQKSSPITRKPEKRYLDIELHLDQVSGCPTAAPSKLRKSLDLVSHEAISSSAVARTWTQGNAMVRVMTGRKT